MSLVTIAFKELLANLLNLRILIAYVIIFVLVVFSVAVKGLQLKDRTEEYQRNSAAFQQAFDKKLDPEEENWYVWDYDVQISPRRLALFCEGFNREISRPFHVAVNPMKALGDFVFENPIFMVYRVYDLVFVVAFLISLLTVFIGYDAFSGERAAGTLRLVLANDISKSTFILGKFIGGYLSLLLPLAAALTAGLLAALVGFGLPFSGTDMLRVLALGGVAALFMAVLFLLAGLCSIIFKRSGTAMFGALLAWFVLAFAWPFVSLSVARRAAPARYLGGMAKAYSTIKIEEAAPRIKEVEKINMEHSGDPEMIRVAWTNYHVRVNKRWAETLQDQRNSLKEQMSLGMALARFSPVPAFIFCASNITGTGLYDYLDFWQWRDELRVANKKAWDDEAARRRAMFAHLPPKERDAKAFVRMDYDISQLPDRHYRGLSLKQVARNCAVEVLALFLTALLLFAAGYSVFIKQEDHR